MFRIAIECHNLENKRWGIGRHLSKILEEISKKPELQKEFRFYLYFKGFIPDDPYLQNPIFVKRVLKLPLLRPSYNIFFHLLLPLRCLRDKIDAAFFPGFMLPLFFFGKSLVVLTNDVYYEYKSGHLPWRYKIGYMLFSNWAAKRATKITTFTETAKKEVAQLFKIKPERIVVNYLGTETLPYAGNHTLSSPRPGEPVPSVPPQAGPLPLLGSESICLPASEYLLYIGQAFPRRRAKETIEAFKIIAPKFPDLKLILVGQDRYNPPIIKKLAEETNKALGEKKIIHYDYIDSDKELKSLIAGAKLFIYLSTSEAMGLPPLEALALGITPLVKNNELNKEIYEGNAFFVQDEKDPKQIALAIEDGLTNTAKREKIIRNSPQVLSKFTWQKHLQKFIETLEKICSTH